MPLVAVFAGWCGLVYLADRGRFESGAVLEGVYFTRDGFISDANEPERVQDLVRWFEAESESCFLTARPSQRKLSDDEAAVRSAIRSTALEHGIDESLAHAIIFVESRCKMNAKSPKGAIGLMQVMPATAREVGVNNPGVPVRNIEAGIRYVAGLRRRFKGSLLRVVSAYNAGPGAVSRYGGVPPYQETRRYAARVLIAYAILQQRRIPPTQRSTLLGA